MSNIYAKLQQVRVDLQNSNLKKSGENKFAKYKYYELADFLPTVVELMNKNKLFTQINFSEDAAELVIIDMEKPDSTITFTSPVIGAELKGCTAIQQLGATQTYIRRYLYTNALDIVESDVVDSQEPVKQQAKPTPKPAVKKQVLNQDQIARLYTIAGAAGKNETDVKAWIKAKWKYTSTTQLTKAQYDEICKTLEALEIKKEETK